MTSNLYEITRAYCEQKNLVSRYIVLPSDDSKLLDLLAAIQPCGVILNSVSVEIAEIVVSLNIPVVGIGVSCPSIPCFYTPFASLFIPAFERAWEAGHRRIALPTVVMSEKKYEQIAGELELHYPGGVDSFSRRFNLPAVPSTTVEDYHAVLREIFRYTPPSCIILSDLSHYLAASSFLQKERLCIPDDVSVILLSYNPLFVDILPSLAYFIQYHPDTVIQACHALQDQMDGLRSHEQVLLAPVWVAGDSLGAPKSR